MVIKGHGYCIIMYYSCTDFDDAVDGGGRQKLRQNNGNNTNDGGGCRCLLPLSQVYVSCLEWMY